nr:SurA N-terminal domain-containing protein [Bacillus pakistanensis]
MKKMLVTLLTGLVIVVLAACGGNEEAKKDDTNKENKQEETAKNEEDAKKQMEEMQKKMDKQKLKEDKKVAVVNDEELLGSDYNVLLNQLQMQYAQMGQDPTSKEISKQVKDQVIESLVGQTLLLQDAEKKGYTASADEVNKELEKLKEQYKEKGQFEKVLKENNMTEDQLKVQIAENIQYTKYMDKEISAGEVKEDEMKKQYDQMAEQAKAAGQEAPKYEEVKETIKGQLENQKKQEKIVQHVEKLKKDAKVEVLI